MELAVHKTTMTLIIGYLLCSATDWITSYVVLEVILMVVTMDLQIRGRATAHWLKHDNPNIIISVLRTGAENKGKIEESTINQWEEEWLR